MPVSTTCTPWFATIWAVEMPAPPAAMMLVFSMTSHCIDSGSAIMKYRLRPKRGSTSASRSGPVDDIAIFMAFPSA